MEIRAWSEVICDELIRFQVIRLRDSVMVWACRGSLRGVVDASPFPTLAVAMPHRSGAEYDHGMPPATTVLPGAGATVSEGISRRLCKQSKHTRSVVASQTSVLRRDVTHIETRT